MYFLVLLQFLLAIIALFLSFQTFLYFKRLWLIKKTEATSFPQAFESLLQKIPHYRALPKSYQKKIQHSILFFLETKEFIPAGLTLTDEIRVIIAFYACLMHLNIHEDCFETLHTIIVYPYDVISHEVRENGGIYTKERFILQGQSSGGTVVIAWNEAKREAYHPKNHNVIIHELAHELDFEDGSIDGIPPLAYGKYHEWTQVMFKEYDKLAEVMHKGRFFDKYKLIGEYAATNEAEFFAVVSELFFQKPTILQKHFPDIYHELKAFYRLDTAALFHDLD